MKKRVVILTGSELRHDFMRMAIALDPGIQVVRSYCEGLERNIRHVIDPNEDGAELQQAHLAARERSEQDFFGAFAALAPDLSQPFHLPKGEINDPRHAEDIAALAPDLVLAYGCSLIREPLLSAFKGRFLNLHLGLSPYYRGAGTNFWPLVNGEPEYVGGTFMHIDAGVDTGAIIHQIRARIFPGDSPHSLGNRLIVDSARTYAAIITAFDRLLPVAEPALHRPEKVYKRKDFSVESVRRLYANFDNGMIAAYLAGQARRGEIAAIAVNPVLGA